MHKLSIICGLFFTTALLVIDLLDIINESSDIDTKTKFIILSVLLIFIISQIFILILG